MADKDDIREGKDFGLGIPQQNKAFYLKGNGALDWGPANRARRLSPMVSAERTAGTTIKRVGLDGREAPTEDEAA